MRDRSRTNPLVALPLIFCAVACNAFTDAEAIRLKAERERGEEAPRCVTPEIECGEVCANLREDPAHCGGCGQLCVPGPNSSAGCFESRCTYTCDEGTEDKNTDLGLGAQGDGCECTPQDPCEDTGAGVCGNGACESGESDLTCCRDCPCDETRVCDEDTNVCRPEDAVCGDGTCDESEGSCCQDCGCADGLACNTDTGLCVEEGVCGDGACQPGEDAESCCQDCACTREYDVCDPDEGVCTLGEWAFVSMGHNPEIGFHASRGFWRFDTSGSYQVREQVQSDPLGFLGSGQLLLDNEGAIFGVDGFREFQGQISRDGALMVLSAAPAPGFVMLVRRASSPSPGDLEGSFRLSGFTEGSDLEGVGDGLQIVEGLLTFDQSGCLVPPGSRLTLGDVAVPLIAACAEITPLGRIKIAISSGDKLQLVGDLSERGPILLSRDLDAVDEMAVGALVMTPIAGRDQALMAEGTYFLGAFRASQGFVESRWGTVRCLDGDLRDGAFETSDDNTPEIRRGAFEVASDGGFDADLFLVGGRDEQEAYRGQAMGDGIDPNATAIITHGRPVQEGQQAPTALMIWIRR